MKFSFLILSLLAFSVPPVSAEVPKEAEARELSTLERFLALDDAQLAQMQQAIARVRAMSPQERAQLRARIDEFRRLPAPEREQLRQGWGHEPADVRDGWREMMQGLDEAARTELRRKLESLPPEERLKFRRELVENFRRAQQTKR